MSKAKRRKKNHINSDRTRTKHSISQQGGGTPLITDQNIIKNGDLKEEMREARRAEIARKKGEDVTWH